MKVENTHSNPIVQKQTENTNAVEKNTYQSDNEPLEKPNSKDRASLSEKAKLLAMARTQLDKIPDIRSEKVNELRTQVEAGNYMMPFEKLATMLVSLLWKD
jgi:negative regulator of flagellin synthesis FlgM